MAGRYLLACLAAIVSLVSCKEEKPQAPKKPAPVIMAKPKPPVLSQEQRTELRIPPEIISQIELAAGAEAGPFFVAILVHSENLKGEKGVERERLAGFSVRTKNADELISSFWRSLRVKGYLIFRSRKSYGTIPDIVTVAKNNSSYDILKIQGTEARNYRLDTEAIIIWFKEQQKQSSFVITGAGPDWLEAGFTNPPKDMQSLARNIRAFAPDVIDPGDGTIDKLVQRMQKMNGFPPMGLI